MSTINRRDFLRAGVAGLGLNLLPAAIQRALALPANNATGSIKDVEHVVILMQENRSFDHYFGTMRGVRGFGDRFTIPQPDGRAVWDQGNGTRRLLPYHLDKRKGNALGAGGAHSWDDSHEAWDDGRMTQWPRAKSDVSMGYLNSADLEFHFALAEAFTVCDAYHCSLHGGTNSNRIFLWTGTNHGPCASSPDAPVAVINNDGWDTLDGTPLEHSLNWTTYPEHLQAAGIGWKVYQNLPDNFTDNPLSGFLNYRHCYQAVNGNLGSYASINAGPSVPWTPVIDAGQPLYKGIGNTMPVGHFALSEFRADVLAGRLPQVSWIVGPKVLTEHPDNTPAQGAYYIEKLLEILTLDPAVWSKTVLFVNYDENDCYFDHLPPPNPPSKDADGTLAGASTVDTSGEYFTMPIAPGALPHVSDGKPWGPGPRVPMLVISPWSRGGWVNSETFDHTSVLRFLEQRFGVVEPNITPWRRAVFGDLTSAFDFVNPNANLPRLPTQNLLLAELEYAGQATSGPVPIPPEDQQRVPEQTPGIRRARALPYRLDVQARIDPESGEPELSFRNAGTSAAVFHVYDRLHLERIPRRYTVAAGKTLSDTWPVEAGLRSYDLWVLGPNGFHRLFRGSAGTERVETEWLQDGVDQTLRLRVRNTGPQAVTVVVSAAAYRVDGPWTRVVAPGDLQELSWSVSAAQGWYDFTVRACGGFTRRVAGHLESGLPSTSDPAMATPNGIAPFRIADRSGVAVGSRPVSEPVVLSGFTGYLPVQLEGANEAEVSIDGGPFVRTTPPVCAGQTLQLRHTAAPRPETLTRSAVTVGSVRSTFTTVTESAGSSTGGGTSGGTGGGSSGGTGGGGGLPMPMPEAGTPAAGGSFGMAGALGLAALAGLRRRIAPVEAAQPASSDSDNA